MRKALPMLLLTVLAIGALPAPASAAGPTIPITFAYGSSGQFLPVIEISINGSPPLRMLADTGSEIVVTFPGALSGAITPPVSTGISHTANYTGTSATGEISLATVTVAGLSTPAPIVFLDASTCTPDCLGDGIGANLDGIFGIGQGEVVVTGSGTSYSLYSALAQLGTTEAEGYTLRFTPTGGTIELGPPVIAPTDAVLQQTATPSTYGNGWTIFEKRVPLCFQLETAQNCLGTTVDSGEFTASLMGTQFVPWVTLFAHPVIVPGVDIVHAGTVNSGHVLSVAPGGGGQPFAQWILDASPHTAAYYTTTGVPYLNTGNGFFIDRPVGFDFRNGQIVVGANSVAPGTPPDVTATAGDGQIRVEWQSATSIDPITAYTVSVRGSDGSVSQQTVAASARSLTLSGLTNGVTYSVGVAAGSTRGIGPAGAIGGLTPKSELAPTGMTLAPTLTAAVLLLLGGAFAARWSRRRSSSR